MILHDPLVQVPDMIDRGTLTEDDGAYVLKFAEFLQRVGPPGTGIPADMWADADWREFMGLEDDLYAWRCLMYHLTPGRPS